MKAEVFTPNNEFFKNYPDKILFVKLEDNEYVPKYCKYFIYCCANIKSINPKTGIEYYVTYENQLSITSSSPEEYLIGEFEDSIIYDVNTIRNEYKEEMESYTFDNFFVDANSFTDSKVHRFQFLLQKVFEDGKEFDIRVPQIRHGKEKKEVIMRDNILTPITQDNK